MTSVHFLQKAHAVDRRRAELPQGCVVGRGAVALVRFKVIFRVLFRHLQHIAVTADLREHRGRRDVGAVPVALYDRAARHLNAGIAVAVDERQFRRGHELRDGPAIARFMARKVALRILSASISSTSARAMP